MDNKRKDELRAQYVKKLFDFLSGEEDCGMTASNSFNFPVVASDGTEGWVEIVVKVPNDGSDDGYSKQEEYQLKLEAAAARKAKAEAEKERRARKQKNKENNS